MAVTGAPSRTMRIASTPSLVILCAVALAVACVPAWATTYGVAGLCVAVLVSGRMPQLRTADVVALAIGGWAYLTRLWSFRPDATPYTAYLYAYAGLAFVATRHIVSRRFQLLAVGFAYIAGCLIAGINVMASVDPAGGQTRQSVLDLTIRFGVQGVNINYTSYTLVTGAVLAVILLGVGAPNLGARLFLASTIPVLGYAVLLTGTRGSVLGLILCAVYLVVSRALPRTAWSATAVVAPALIVLVPLGAMPGAEISWLDNLFGRPTGDLSGRLGIWAHCLSRWSDAIYTGMGAGAYRFSNVFGVPPHSLLLTLGVDLGLIGVALYAYVFVSTLARSAPRADRTCQRMTGAFVATLLPIWLTGMWESSVGVWMTLALLSVVPHPQPVLAAATAGDLAAQPGPVRRPATVSGSDADLIEEGAQRIRVHAEVK